MISVVTQFTLYFIIFISDHLSSQSCDVGGCGLFFITEKLNSKLTEYTQKIITQGHNNYNSN